ncbi:putative enniatin synthase [Zalerion maritima]|uniref:2-dehydropantoate 2-reductase n=1 Tax=Zalerion maritima TaxID=339359 RepID=A0AAD5RNS6_9PEZI|nr:putative enniatin synthase [Zalerion maritima]
MSSANRPGIHILGVGNVGKFIAHVIRLNCPNTPITFLFHRESSVQNWNKAGKVLRCLSSDGIEEQSNGFGAETCRPAEEVGRSQSLIDRLIVATKSYATASAIGPIKHRLGASSYVLFLQNGMGALDEVTKLCFPDPSTRPRYWAGICSFGVYNREPFSIVHAGTGSLTLGEVGAAPGPIGEDNPFADLVLRCPALEAKLVGPTQFHKAQVQKLVVNAVINPLTVIFNCKNSGILAPTHDKLRKELIEESGRVVRHLVPEAEERTGGVGDLDLMQLVLSVAENTGENTSSMLQDVRAGRRTEIAYINGYLAAKGRKLGLPTPHNSKLVAIFQILEEMGSYKQGHGAQTAQLLFWPHCR